MVPEEILRPVTVAGGFVNVNLSASDIAEKPYADDWRTRSTTPTGSAGDTAVSDVGLLTRKLAAGTEPKLTPVTEPRFNPLIWTTVPPRSSPLDTDKAVITGLND
jgi:hypothetical protein